ncbi:MAG: hypothetical protein ACREQ5_07015, partial [Candidatus Dormibacteria bacterium]
KWHLEHSEELQKEFHGDVKAESSKWSESAIILSTRTINRKEPSIDTCALDRPKVGGHYDLIIIDDLHTRENITPKLLRKSRMFLNDLQPLLKPGGVLVLVGTRWHHQDIYSHILEVDAQREKKGKGPAYSFLRKGCYDGPGGLFFPSVLSAEVLEDYKLNMTTKEFATQFLNMPIEEDTAVFPHSTLQFFSGTYTARPNNFPLLRID